MQLFEPVPLQTFCVVPEQLFGVLVAHEFRLSVVQVRMFGASAVHTGATFAVGPQVFATVSVQSVTDP